MKNKILPAFLHFSFLLRDILEFHIIGVWKKVGKLVDDNLVKYEQAVLLLKKFDRLLSSESL